MKNSNQTEAWKRLAGLLIDMAIIIGLLFLVVFLYETFNNVGGIKGFLRFMNFTNWIALILFGIYLVYYVFMEAVFGKTIGKLILGIKVIDNEGAKPSIGKVLLRSFIRLIPVDWFTYLKKNPLGWHDLFSKTRVISIT